MAKVFFEKLTNQGTAVSPIDSSENKWFTVQLYTKNGIMRNRVKVNFWEKEISETELLNLKENALFGEGEIITEAVPEGYEVNGNMVNRITVFVPAGKSLASVLIGKGIKIETAVEVED